MESTDSNGDVVSARSDLSRRSVLVAGTAVGAAGLLAACGGGGDSGATTAAPAPAPAPTTTTGGGSPTPTVNPGPDTALAAVSDIPVGGGQVFDGPKVVVTQPTEGTFLGFSTTGTHTGTAVNQVDGGEIVCPNHGSRFSVEDGSALQGPASAPLASIEVALEGDEIVLA